MLCGADWQTVTGVSKEHNQSRLFQVQAVQEKGMGLLDPENDDPTHL